MSEPKRPSDYAREFLQKGGFPLEMRTARTFLEAGLWDVRPGDFYTDPDEDKPRELDLTVTRCAPISTACTAGLTLAVECKRGSVEKPWVAFPTPGAQQLEAHWAAKTRITTEPGRFWLNDIAPMITDWSRFPLLRSTHRPAYGIVVAGGEDHAYKAMMTAAKAAGAIRDQLNEREDCPVAAVLPLVVIEGAICEATLDERGELEIAEVDRVQVAWRAPVAGLDYTMIDIITESHLPTYVDQFKLTADNLTSEFGVMAIGAIQAWSDSRINIF